MELSLADLNLAIEIEPRLAIAYFNRGRIRLTQGDLDGAIRDLDQAIGINPRLAWAYNNRANARIDKSDLNGAIDDYDRAITIEPGNAMNYYEPWVHATGSRPGDGGAERLQPVPRAESWLEIKYRSIYQG